MSAQDQIRKMLDELMGTGRDGESRRDTVRYTDTRVCRTFLLGCCPFDVLANTRMDMGLCPKIHDPALKADYEKAAKDGKVNFDVDALDHLDRFFTDSDRKMEQAKKRLAETQEEMNVELTEKADKVLMLNEEIGKALAQAEKLGEEGKVEESLQLMGQVDELRKQKQEADLDYRNSMPASSYQQQKLRVCEVCSAYLGIHDNDRRLADHFGGKLHMGYAYLRERYAALKEAWESRRAQRDAQSSEKKHEGHSKRFYNHNNGDSGGKDRYNRDLKRARSPEPYDRGRRRFDDRRKERDRSRNKERYRRSRSRSPETSSSKRHKHGKYSETDWKGRESAGASPQAFGFGNGREDGLAAEVVVERKDARRHFADALNYLLTNYFNSSVCILKQSWFTRLVFLTITFLMLEISCSITEATPV
ncbi:hypothetical protein M514_10550, partial [Trichuris suis]